MVGFAMGATTRDRRDERPPLGTERQKSVVIVRMSSTDEAWWPFESGLFVGIITEPVEYLH